jgi:hypothetical protein
MSIRSLGQLALALAILFATVLAGAMFPLEPFDPAWQARFIPALINIATLPLISLALLQIGTVLAPQDPFMKRRRILFEQVAIAAALGFILLIPLQITANLRLQQRDVAEQTQRIKTIETRLSAVRQAVDEAKNSADLNARLRGLSFVELAGTEVTKPLPELRDEVNIAFARMQKQIAQEKTNLPSANPLLLLPELLRSSIALLALAGGYAAFARRPHDHTSLLERSIHRRERLGEGRGRSSDPSHRDYLTDLHDHEDR